MDYLQKIEIDWDIHKLIEAERRSFEEPPYIALRRLLKLPALKLSSASELRDIGTGSPWTDEGVTVPHGSLAQMKYDRGAQVYEGQFLNGQLVVNGERFSSLSAAANALAVTKEGRKNPLNGGTIGKQKFSGEAEWR